MARDELSPAARLLNERPRVFWGKVIRVQIENGWNPPRPDLRIVERITADIERIETIAKAQRGTAFEPTLEPTARERKIVYLLASGLTYREIADELGVGVETIRRQQKILLRRLGARNAAHAVALCIRSGVLDVESLEAVDRRAA